MEIDQQASLFARQEIIIQAQSQVDWNIHTGINSRGLGLS